MKYLALPALLALVACDTASPAFKGAPAQTITVGQSTFDVRVVENRAEAIRTNSEWAPRLAAVAPRATAAIEKVSGCEVKRLYGDQAIVLADLKCGKQAVPLPPQAPLYCEIVSSQEVGDRVYHDLTCD